MLVKNTFNTAQLIPHINAPLLIIHGDSETLIPIPHARRLYDMVKEQPKTKFVEIKGVGHNNYYILDDLVYNVRTYLMEHSISVKIEDKDTD